MFRNHEKITSLLGGLAIAATVFLTALPAAAAAALPSLVPECARQGTNVPTLNCALQTFANIANIILGLTGSAALLMFVYGGFLMLSSAGEAEKVNEGKTVLRNAVIGIAIIMLSGYVIRYGLDKLQVKSSIGSSCNDGKGVTINLPDGKTKCVTSCQDADLQKTVADQNLRYDCIDVSKGSSCIAGICNRAADSSTGRTGMTYELNTQCCITQ